MIRKANKFHILIRGVVGIVFGGAIGFLSFYMFVELLPIPRWVTDLFDLVWQMRPDWLDSTSGITIILLLIMAIMCGAVVGGVVLAYKSGRLIYRIVAGIFAGMISLAIAGFGGLIVGAIIGAIVGTIFLVTEYIFSSIAGLGKSAQGK